MCPIAASPPPPPPPSSAQPRLLPSLTPSTPGLVNVDRKVQRTGGPRSCLSSSGGTGASMSVKLVGRGLQSNLG